MLHLLLSFAATTNAQNIVCVPLTNSQMCPEFSGYSFQAFTANPVIIDTVQKLDQYVEVNALFNQGPKCPKWPSARDANMRYARSTACAIIVRLGSANCNKNKPALNFCRKSAENTVQDLGALLNRFCPGVPVDGRYTSVQPSLSTSSNCLVGLGEEKSLTCGVETSKLTQYCSENSGSDCCPKNVPIGDPSTQQQVPPTPASTGSVIAAPTAVANSTIETLAPLPTTINTEPPINQPDDSLTTNSNESKFTNLLTPLNIGIAAGVLALILAGIASVIYSRRKQKSTAFITPKSVENNNGSNYQKMDVMFDYQANLVDELTLSTIF